MFRRNQAILVLYHTRGLAQLPLRAAVADHLFAWGRYSRYPVIYHNFAYGFDFGAFRNIPLKAVILDTLALNLRWDPDFFHRMTEPLRALADFPGPKIAMPQDEFIHTDMLCDFLKAIGVTHVLSAAEPREARKIYAALGERVTLRTALTGYLDPRRVRRLRGLGLWRRRDIDIGYRAWNAEPWLGAHSLLKIGVAKAALAAASRHPGLRLDVSVDDKATFYGDDWYRFLLRCRATLGAEGGASILDHDGAVRDRTRAYVATHPEASFAEIREACFAEKEGSLRLFAIGPRHLEACATRTCQILVEGIYQGILRPWLHYIPVKRDFSDIDQAFAALQDRNRVDAMIERSWQDVVGSGRYSYPRFVRRVERLMIDAAVEFPKARLRDTVSDALRIRTAMVRHWFSFAFARFEARHLLTRHDYYSVTALRHHSSLHWRLIKRVSSGFVRLTRLEVELPL